MSEKPTQQEIAEFLSSRSGRLSFYAATLRGLAPPVLGAAIALLCVQWRAGVAMLAVFAVLHLFGWVCSGLAEDELQREGDAWREKLRASARKARGYPPSLLSGPYADPLRSQNP